MVNGRVGVSPEYNEPATIKSIKQMNSNYNIHRKVTAQFGKIISHQNKTVHIMYNHK